MSRYVTLRLTRVGVRRLFDATGLSLAPGKYHINTANVFEPPCKVGRSADFKASLNFGAFSTSNGVLNDGIVFRAKIGRYCSIAKHAKIGLLQHPVSWLGTASVFFDSSGKHMFNWDGIHVIPFESQGDTEIGNDVWIGSGASIMTGCKVGDGAIIASEAVVTHDVPPYAIVGGVPARVIRYRFDEDTIKELLDLRWWRYDLADLGEIDWRNTKAAIAAIRERLAKHPEIKPYEPKPVSADELRPYAFRTLFFFEISRRRIRIKLFGLWVVHFIRRGKRT